MNRKEMHDHYLSLGWGNDPHSNHVFDFTLEAVAAAKGGAVLDAGAGFQACRPFFEESTYIAQEHPDSGAKSKGIKAFDILCDVMNIPLIDDSVRVVFSNVSVEHMRYPVPFFSEAHRVLEPGGKLFVQVPFVYMEHEKPYDFQRPTSFGLRRWFDDAGFADCKVEPTSSSIYTIAWAGQHALKEELSRGFPGQFSRLKAFVTFGAAYLLLRHLKGSYDRGPFADAAFPIAWTAIGTKAGEPTTATGAVAARQFLEQNRIEDSHFEGDVLILGKREAVSA